MKNILVTGGAGFIGSHTVKELVKQGYKPIVLDNLSYGHKYIVGQVLKVPFVKGDISDRKLIKKLFSDFSIDAVLHFAAYAYVGESCINPIKYYENNLIGTINLLNEIIEFSKKEKKERPIPIVFSSTCATYGITREVPIKENTLQNPINPYGNSKLFIEKILEDYSNAYNLSSISFRYFNAAGASKDSSLGENHIPETHLIPLTFDATREEKKPLIIFGSDYPTDDGTCIRDYIHVEDLADAHVIGLKKVMNSSSKFSEVYNLATGKGYSVLEIIKTVEKITNNKVNFSFGEKREGDPPILIADPTKANRELGWKAKNLSIETIIQDAWRWYIKLNIKL
tara:strand:- start:440 stop:1459 length:1020 start_codon:yes stop_codon:yes gene_type:complete